MSVSERSLIDAIRNSVAIHDGSSILQKVISKSDISKYISGDYYQIGEFVTSAKDAKHLKTFEDIFYGLRLDYKKLDGTNPFKLSDGSCGVIRYRTANPNLTIPKLKYSPEDPPLPFTGNGFSGGNNGRLGVPEWNSQFKTPLENSELYEVYSNGSEVLVAKFSTQYNKFIPVE